MPMHAYVLTHFVLVLLRLFSVFYRACRIVLCSLSIPLIHAYNVL